MDESWTGHEWAMHVFPVTGGRAWRMIACASQRPIIEHIMQANGHNVVHTTRRVMGGEGLRTREKWCTRMSKHAEVAARTSSSVDHMNSIRWPRVYRSSLALMKRCAFVRVWYVVCGM